MIYLVRHILVIEKLFSLSLHAELQCGACSLWLRARIIQSWGISAHWEENRRTQVPPVRTHVVVQIPPDSAILQTKFKHIYCDIK